MRRMMSHDRKWGGLKVLPPQARKKWRLDTPVFHRTGRFGQVGAVHAVSKQREQAHSEAA
jgi:hypothetical protein